MWRYKEPLAVDGDVAVGHHVGFTPLIRAQNLADELGCREIWVKNDSVCHPTWSFKDRVVSVAITKAREIRFRHRGLRLDRQSGQLRRCPGRQGRLKSYIFIGRPRAEQGARHLGLQPDPRRGARHLR
jgi:threonine synthase